MDIRKIPISRSYKSNSNIKSDSYESNKEYNINNEEEHNYFQKELHLKYRCEICNFMKGSLTKETFINQIESIYNFNKERSTTIPKGSTLQVNGSGNGEHLNEVMI